MLKKNQKNLIIKINFKKDLNLKNSRLKRILN